MANTNNKQTRSVTMWHAATFEIDGVGNLIFRIPEKFRNQRIKLLYAWSGFRGHLYTNETRLYEWETTGRVAIVEDYKRRAANAKCEINTNWLVTGAYSLDDYEKHLDILYKLHKTNK